MNDDALVRVTVGYTAYVVYPDKQSRKKLYDIFILNNDGSLRYFKSFDNPAYLDGEKLAEHIRQYLAVRTGITG